MKEIFKKGGYKSQLTKWYIGIFTVVVIGFTYVIYLNMSRQIWDKFNYGISQLAEEMLEELSELRDDLNDEDFDDSVIIEDFIKELDNDEFGPIIWTRELREKFKSDIEQEFIDESIDHFLPTGGVVQIRNLISENWIYQSPEIEQYGFQFNIPQEKLWGYMPFEEKGNNLLLKRGIGYSGVRYSNNFFVGVMPESDDYQNDNHILQKIVLTLYHMVESIERKADSLYVEDEEFLVQMIKNIDADGYIYIHENDTILWATKNMRKNEIYIPTRAETSDIIALPREVIPKEYFFDISDNRNRHYRQYTLIYDLIPTFLYKVDIAIPTEKIEADTNLLLVAFSFGAVLLISIVWIGGNFINKRALQPVDEIIKSVNDITSSNLEKRLPVPQIENEIMRLVRTFNGLLTRLAESFKMQKTFIADASHELRTPLSILLSDIETALQNPQDKSKLNGSLNNAVKEIERMARIVDDLNLLAIKDSGNVNLNMQLLRLDDILITTISRCQAFAGSKKIKLTIKQIEIFEITGDEELLIRALSNLVFNAINYSEENTEVELSIFKKNGYASLSVTDHGMGISQHDQARIFDRFFRVDASRSRDTGGSGLGLAIAKWIVELHGGEIKVISELNKGSTFQIQLPLKH
jgi:heavy metal sensor kinase